MGSQNLNVIPMNKSLPEQFASIRNFVFDIDGVMTNGQLLLHSDGELLRAMNIRDGYALQLAVKKGYSVHVISGGRGEALLKRLNGLGIQQVYLGVDDKLGCLLDCMKQLDDWRETTLYMGDDMPDIPALSAVNLPCCPQDACPEVQLISKYVSPFAGGQGCVRDVIEKVLKLHGHWG